MPASQATRPPPRPSARELHLNICQQACHHVPGTPGSGALHGPWVKHRDLSQLSWMSARGRTCYDRGHPRTRAVLYSSMCIAALP